MQKKKDPNSEIDTHPPYELTDEMFIHRGKDTSRMDEILRPALSFRQDAWQRFRKNRFALAGLCIFVCYVLLAVFVPICSRYEAADMDIGTMFLKPFTSGHLLGCDNVGRDLWTRVWSGGQVSLTIGIAVAIINASIGYFIGGLCGYFGGKTDMIIMRLVDLLYGIPSLVVTFLVMMVAGTGIRALIIALCVVGWIGPCHFIRGEVYRLKELDYVQAAKVLGESDLNILLRHILPNLLGIMVANTCMAVPLIIFQEAFLSYIGLGIQAPDCSWGVMAKEGIQFFQTAPHIVLVPAFFISTTVLALNLIADGLRDASDPRLRGTE